ncbi:MAG: hypothetical protein ACK4K7_02255 [Allosphingosinicella sp.]|uniref:hypothetical protein n=1 Tax=Allosphingosinicella sp. TaxID=2823234 RepID=UPI003920D218
MLMELMALAMAAAPRWETVPAGEAPALQSDESAEEIAKDAARDLKDNRFYNRPGATRAEYDADWQRCRLIARGSRTPTGHHTYFYDPNVISPLAAGIGAGIGGAIAGAIIQGQLRRENRRSCLLINGWRLVEVEDAERTRIAAMSDEERDAYFNAIIGAEELSGKRVTAWHNDFAAPRLAPESEQ